jgi:hypothetical protein
MAMGTRIAPLVLVVLAGGVAAQPRDACMRLQADLNECNRRAR